MMVFFSRILTRLKKKDAAECIGARPNSPDKGKFGYTPQQRILW